MLKVKGSMVEPYEVMNSQHEQRRLGIGGTPEIAWAYAAWLHSCVPESELAKVQEWVERWK